MRLTAQPIKKFFLAAMFCVTLLGWGFTNQGIGQSSSIARDEAVIFFPTSASLNADGSTWTIPIHGWIFEREEDSVWRTALVDTLLASLELDKSAVGHELFRKRAGMFLVDNESGKKLSIRLASQMFTLNKSANNGHATAMLQVGRRHLKNAGAGDWIRFEAVLPTGDFRRFAGQVQLAGPQGVSVISDIDDTIKHSSVLDQKELLANTFLREFEAVPGMAEVYRQWSKAGMAFHYVSRSPWQLYPALVTFVHEQGFPRGSFHLRTFRSREETFSQLFGKLKQIKPEAIESILKRYPHRRFILVGDSGQQDPEIYGAIARQYPGQIIQIAIRNVTGQAAGSDRFLAAFKGVAKERWTVFSDPQELLKQPILSATVHSQPASNPPPKLD